MALFAIGDTHLSFGTDKPMNVFRGWDNYVERLEENWKKLIGEGDTVVLMGDISWAMNLDELREDFRFIDSLPGKKLIMKGNHDYWWNTLTKLNAFLGDNGFDSISFLFNNAYLVDGIAVCGTRGWFFDSEEAQSDKIVLRETGRLYTSIRQAKMLGGEPVAFLHYPPLTKQQQCEPIVKALRDEGVKYCYYAHLHGASAYNAFIGTEQGIRFELLSADYLKFCPMPIKLTK